MADLVAGFRALTSRAFWTAFRDYWHPAEVAARVGRWALDVHCSPDRWGQGNPPWPFHRGGRRSDGPR